MNRHRVFQDLEEQLEEEEGAKQRLLLEKVSLETKVKSLETDLLTAVEQRDRLSKVSFTLNTPIRPNKLKTLVLCVWLDKILI